MTRILILADYAAAQGGAERVAINSAIGLAGLGHRVTFIGGTGAADPEMTAAGVDVAMVGTGGDLKSKGPLKSMIGGLWSTDCLRRVEEILRSAPVGGMVVHVHTWLRALTSSVLKAIARSGHPTVVTLHDYGVACPNQGFFDYQANRICTRVPLGLDCLTTHCDTRTYAHKLWRAARTGVQKYAAGFPKTVSDVVYLSELSREVLAGYFPTSTRWHAVRNPIPIECAPRAVAERNGGFLFVGRLTPEKGVDIFLQAACDAGVAATVVGDGESRIELEARFPQARFKGWLAPAQVQAELRGTRALVFPSRWYEGQPLVVQEALACGVPAVVADRTGAREAVEDGLTGLHFAQMDIADLSRQLARLRDDALVASLSACAYDRFWSDPPTMNTHCEQLLRIYAAAVEAV